jgi:hypothetical protein
VDEYLQHIREKYFKPGEYDTQPHYQELKDRMKLPYGGWYSAPSIKQGGPSQTIEHMQKPDPRQHPITGRNNPTQNLSEYNKKRVLYGLEALPTDDINNMGNVGEGQLGDEFLRDALRQIRAAEEPTIKDKIFRRPSTPATLPYVRG